MIQTAQRGIEVVPFLANDERRAQALEVFLGVFPRLDENMFSLHIDQKGKLGFLAVNAGGDACGVALASVNTPSYQGTDEARLEYFGVSNNGSRKNGIGRTMLGILESEILQEGKSRISLKASSEYARKFYTLNGYRLVNGQTREMQKSLRRVKSL